MVNNLGPGNSPPKNVTNFRGTSGEPPSDDTLARIRSLESDYLQVSVNIASMKTKLDELPSKDWVHLRLWAVAAVIIGAVGLMIRFLPAAG